MTNLQQLPDEAVFTTRLSAPVQAVVQRALEERRLVGAVVLVARDGELLHRQAAGFADHEQGRPMTLQALFRLVSVTKPIVSAAALVQVARGLLELPEAVYGIGEVER